MVHPAYVDYFCEKHEKSHQEDICPLCWYEQEFCEEHELEMVDGECERCAERYNDMLSQRELSQDGAR